MSDKDFSGSIGCETHLRIGYGPGAVILFSDGAGGLTTSAGTTASPATSVAGAGNNRAVAFETMSRLNGPFAIATTSARRYLNYFTATSAKAFSSLEVRTGAGAPNTVTAARFGLYLANADGSLTMVCQTANDATLLSAASTTYLKALDTTGGFPASYTLIPGQRYAASYFSTATGTGSPLGIAMNDVTLAAAAPRISGYDGGSGTDLRAAIAAVDVTNYGNIFYMAGV